MSHPKYKNTGTPWGRVIEECSELIQAISKAERFGWFGHHPDTPGRDNIDQVRYEIDDVLETINVLDRHLASMRQIQGK